MKITGYALYSEKQRTYYGLWEYNTPEGKTVICSSVVQDPTGSSCGFEDKQMLGPVTTMVKRLENNKKL